ncbi:MAG: hypothetical protein H6832_05555 [Planctomycetes bacterium]|nr:hypothetical protein [Planctomycetota bacterium]MCB9917849.1 hypothetical protein [Planctomycetota bacterium]
MIALVLRRGALGDTIVMLPILDYLATDPRIESVDFAGVSDFAELFEERGRVRRALSSETLALHRTLLGETLAWVDRYDLVIGEPALPHVNPRSLAFDVRVDEREDMQASRQLFERFAAVFEARFGMRPRHDGRVRIKSLPTDGPRREDHVWIHAGAGSAKKLWPAFEARAPALVHDLLEAGLDVTISFGPADASLRTSLRTDPRTRIVESPRITEFARGLTTATVFLGHDTGPAHLAAALGLPTVILIGDASHQRVWMPYGRIDPITIDWTDMSTDEVLSAIRAIVRDTCSVD